MRAVRQRKTPEHVIEQVAFDSYVQRTHTLPLPRQHVDLLGVRKRKDDRQQQPVLRRHHRLEVRHVRRVEGSVGSVNVPPHALVRKEAISVIQGNAGNGAETDVLPLVVADRVHVAVTPVVQRVSHAVGLTDQDVVAVRRFVGEGVRRLREQHDLLTRCENARGLVRQEVRKVAPPAGGREVDGRSLRCVDDAVGRPEVLVCRRERQCIVRENLDTGVLKLLVCGTEVRPHLVLDEVRGRAHVRVVRLCKVCHSLDGVRRRVQETFHVTLRVAQHVEKVRGRKPLDVVVRACEAHRHTFVARVPCLVQQVDAGADRDPADDDHGAEHHRHGEADRQRLHTEEPGHLVQQPPTCVGPRRVV
eukprot:Rhum_TRINITY_DN15474_c3_g1::Rhum_TRINITY_DN15474_c3_g1_i3::g.160351::m.160351